MSRPRIAWPALALATVASVVIALASCGPTTTKGVQAICCPVRGDAVELTYLGSGGWVIEAGGEMLLTAPLFSNPGPLTVLTGVLEVETELIEEQSTVYGLDEALAVLVGHGHYDHLMDVPYLAVAHATSAAIYGSTTVRNQILAYPGLAPERIIDVDDRAATPDAPGRWTEVGTRFRFLPVRSLHSPHTEEIHLWQGERTAPMAHLPRTAHDWLEGSTYAYLIDVLDARGEPELRIYYNDSASTYPMGFPPRSPEGGRDVPTLTILTAPGHKWETDYPAHIVSYLDADYALVGHWEYFFGNWGRFQFGTPTTDLGAFLEGMDGLMPGAWWLPAVGAKFVLEPEAP